MSNGQDYTAMQSAIERLFAGPVEPTAAALATFREFRDALTQGKIRAAEKHGDRKSVV